MRRGRLPVGRFQVMATLQAARAYVLGLPLESAKSFGLNRAIFYAAAKRGFKKPRKVEPPKESKVKIPIPKDKLADITKSFEAFNIGDEMAYSVTIEGRRFFVIGNDVQTPEDFKRQIEDRFKGKFNLAWQEAVEMCKSIDRGILLSQRYFYEVLYKPRRDELSEKWSMMVECGEQDTLEKRSKEGKR